MRGIFVTFEGGEGAGKTAQVKALANHLRALGQDVVETRDPGGTTIGKEIRNLLLDRENTRMADRTELLLYQASRAQLVQEVIAPALEAGRIVLSDRFTDSTIAYQGYGRGLDVGVIRAMNDFATQGIRPDLIFLLDLDPRVGLHRAGRGTAAKAPDRIEAEVLAFHQRVREGYLTLAREEPFRIVRVDAAQGMAEIAEQVWDHFQAVVSRVRGG